MKLFKLLSHDLCFCPEKCIVTLDQALAAMRRFCATGELCPEFSRNGDPDYDLVLRGVSLGGASRGQPRFLVCLWSQDGGGALTIGREVQRKRKGARVTDRTVSWVSWTPHLSPPLPRCSSSGKRCLHVGFGPRNNHECASPPS